MSKRYCCVNGCSNGTYRLKQWKSTWCSKHGCNFGTSRCICDPPFKLIAFPSENKDPYARSIWVKNVYRKNLDGTNWQPNIDSRVCSKHFVDGYPSLDNPYPTLCMGHDFQFIPKSRLPPKEREHTSIPVKKRKSSNINQDETNISFSFDHDHGYQCKCTPCLEKDDIIKSLKAEIMTLKSKVAAEKVKKSNGNSNIFSFVVRSDKKMKFYTGIPTVDHFNKSYKIIEPMVNKVRYWKGPKYHCNPLKYKVLKKRRENKKLTAREEMILTLMKLKLGLLDEDLADRFNVSTSHVSRIFTTWLNILSEVFGALVYNPPREIVRENLPLKFKNSQYSGVRHIIDCSEVFIEKPQNLEVRAKTWSDYKQHHTAKFLVSITPSGMFNFVSETWGGRASDKHITTYSGFLDIIEPYDVILADRGFQIQREVTLQNAFLMVPPSRRGVAQMTQGEVKKTKEIANHRIYIEQAIRRMKYFRILKYEIPITLCQHMDKIVKVVCGICNFLPTLPKY